MSDRELTQPSWTSGFVRVNDVRLHVVEAGPADGPVLILLHGFPEFWWTWRHQVGPLAQAGFRVIAPDMRGYDLSDAPRGIEPYHLDTLASDVVALAAACGAERFRLVGHDWGGVVAWWVAARYPERVEQLVILDAPHPDVFATHATTHLSQPLRSIFVLLFQLPWLPEAALSVFRFAGLRTLIRLTARRGAIGSDELDHYVDAWRRGSLTGMINYYRAVRKRKIGVPARIAPPTLVLWGEDDTFLGLPLAQASVEMCDTGELKPVKGATHWLQWEEPDRVTSEILGFLSPTRPAIVRSRP